MKTTLKLLSLVLMLSVSIISLQNGQASNDKTEKNSELDSLSKSKKIPIEIFFEFAKFLKSENINDLKLALMGLPENLCYNNNEWSSFMNGITQIRKNLTFTSPEKIITPSKKVYLHFKKYKSYLNESKEAWMDVKRNVVWINGAKNGLNIEDMMTRGEDVDSIIASGGMALTYEDALNGCLKLNNPIITLNDYLNGKTPARFCHLPTIADYEKLRDDFGYDKKNYLLSILTNPSSNQSAEDNLDMPDEFPINLIQQKPSNDSEEEYPALVLINGKAYFYSDESSSPQELKTDEILKEFPQLSSLSSLKKPKQITITKKQFVIIKNSVIKPKYFWTSTKNIEDNNMSYVFDINSGKFANYFKEAKKYELTEEQEDNRPHMSLPLAYHCICKNAPKAQELKISARFYNETALDQETEVKEKTAITE
ncbi:MAG: hypothetical protein HQK49_11935 [Oligoflexia bacterium]|nr:hypothetical protein [Oligoflexia bacterium]